MEEEKKVSEEYRPLFTYVKTKTQSEESDEDKDECEEYDLTYEEWLYRKANGLQLFKYNPEEYEEEEELSEAEKNLKLYYFL